MSLKKRTLKSLRETQSARLPIHASDASDESADTLSKIGPRPVKPHLDGQQISKNAAGRKMAKSPALPTHPSEAAVEIPEEDEIDLDNLDEEEEEEEEEKLDEEDEEELKLSEEEEEEKLDEEDEEELKLSEEEEEEIKEKEEGEVEEDVEALTKDEELPESFKRKAALIFSAAVTRAAKRRASLQREKLVETYKKTLHKSKKHISDTLVNKIDGYLDYVVEEWMKDNEVAIETGFKNELTEKFISRLKSLFESHYIEVPAKKENLLEEQKKKISRLKRELNSEIQKVVELRKENSQIRKESAIKKLSEGLSVNEASKLKELCESVSYESAKSFEHKLNVIRESFFPKVAIPKSRDLDNSLITDGGISYESTDKSDIDIYADTLSRMLKR